MPVFHYIFFDPPKYRREKKQRKMWIINILHQLCFITKIIIWPTIVYNRIRIIVQQLSNDHLNSLQAQLLTKVSFSNTYIAIYKRGIFNITNI